MQKEQTNWNIKNIYSASNTRPVPRQMQVSRELEIKASYEAALLVGGRLGEGSFAECWRKHVSPKPWRLEVNTSSQASVPDHFHAGTPANIKGTHPGVESSDP